MIEIARHIFKRHQYKWLLRHQVDRLKSVKNRDQLDATLTILRDFIGQALPHAENIGDELDTLRDDVRII